MSQLGAIVGMTVGVGTVVAIWATARGAVAWPWFVFIGLAVTMVGGVGFQDAAVTAARTAGAPTSGRRVHRSGDGGGTRSRALVGDRRGTRAGRRDRRTRARSTR